MRIPVLLVCLALPTLADAERPLSLDEGLALARTANRDLAAAREPITQAEADVAAARSCLLPALSAQGTFLRNDSEVKFDLGGMAMTLQSETQKSGSATLTVPLLEKVRPPNGAVRFPQAHPS
jgi:outer membrane protein TolC